MFMLPYWNIEEMTGYKPKTTFYLDFSIADVFGLEAIRDTYNRAFEEWKNNIEYFTELAMVLNWKSWEHNEYDEKKCKLYSELWAQIDSYACENLTGNDLSYYYNTTD